MPRSLSLAALMVALTISGCGQSNSPPPAAAPAPAYQPPAQPPESEAAQPSQTSDIQAPENQRAEAELGSASSLTSDKDPPDGAPAEDKEKMADEAGAAPAAKTPGDEPAETTDAVTTDDGQSSTRKSNRPGRKLLRGLGSSLGRALSKAASNTGTSDSGSADKAKPAPDLKDDPYPNGEPNDSKADDSKPNE
jgi:hypothetical protein